MNEALRDWVTNVRDTYYIIGTAAGPHPYPAMVRDFQSIIGKEVREQMQEAEGRLPDTLVACIGGGSNAIGLFHPFLDDESVKIYGVEAGGHGLEVPNGHAASMTGGTPGVLHGNRTYLLQDEDGQILEGHSISAGLDYPGVGPEHSWLKDSGRVTYVSATDKEALDAFQLCTQARGHHPGARAGARAGLRHEARADAAQGQPAGHEHVRPRRQGHLRRRRPPRHEDVNASPPTAARNDPSHDQRDAHRSPLRHAEAATAARPRHLHHRRRSRLRDLEEDPARPAARPAPTSSSSACRSPIRWRTARRSRRRRCARSSPARPCARRWSWCAAFRKQRPRHAHRADGLLQSRSTSIRASASSTTRKAAGVDGLIIVDLPPEADEELCLPAIERGLNFIRLATPTTDAKRLPAVLRNTSGFLYYVSITGITGTAAPDVADVHTHVARIKKATALPVAVGFGVKTPGPGQGDCGGRRWRGGRLGAG